MADKLFYSRHVVTINSGTVFYTENKYTPLTSSVMVYYNGLLLVSGDDYIEKDEHNIELTFKPYTGDVLIIAPVASSTMEIQNGISKPSMTYDEFKVVSTNRIFNLRNKYIPKTNTISVFVNGLLLDKTRYQEVNSETIKILGNLETGDTVTVIPTVKVDKNISVARSGLVNQEKWSRYEEFIVQKEEREFKLKHRYAPNANQIMVYHNGIALDSDYFMEVDELTILLKFFPEKNDVIVVVPTMNPDIKISNVKGEIVGSRNDSLFHRYGVEKHLMPNQNYELKVVLDGKESIFKFTSAYTPFYTTTKIIRSDLMEILDEMEDDKINFIIWQNSKLVEELYENAVADKNKSVNIKNWVRYRTELDLINTTYINIAASAGSQQKTLGNMQVSKSIKIPYLDEMTKMIKRKLDAEEIKLSGVRVIGRAARKANKTDYPITPERRSF